ncbi:hypothetical protein V8C44DRAFT_330703 [Trichoderma aethiopicum]
MFSSSQSVISSLFWLSAKWVAAAITNASSPARKGWRILRHGSSRPASFLASFASNLDTNFDSGRGRGWWPAATLVTHQARGNGGVRLSSRDCDLASPIF